MSFLGKEKIYCVHFEIDFALFLYFEYNLQQSHLIVNIIIFNISIIIIITVIILIDNTT